MFYIMGRMLNSTSLTLKNLARLTQVRWVLDFT
ncbi:hypothetical protein GECvBGOT_gp186 [Salmonella phage GEC_vB_GOT]|nr:hypothetical protein GECvBGOT_gp186 [Salmonella phage GEC_vB_GOT]